MNTSTLRVLALSSLAALLIPCSGMAQRSADFQIPFDFTVANKTMAAGHSRASESVRNVLTFQRVDVGSRMSIVALNDFPGKADTRTTLKFRRYGNRYFIISMMDSNRGWRLPKCKQEKELIATQKQPALTGLLDASLK